MRIKGIILHHSVCSSINGKGYDFLITKEGMIIPANEETDPNFIHICLEGDFGRRQRPFTSEQKEQLFLLHKLTVRMSDLLGLAGDQLYPHNLSCPGAYFPWSELVISPKDGYH